MLLSSQSNSPRRDTAHSLHLPEGESIAGNRSQRSGCCPTVPPPRKQYPAQDSFADLTRNRRACEIACQISRLPDIFATMRRIVLRMRWLTICLALSLSMVANMFSADSEGVTPWRQDQPPNEPYSPREAIRKMTVPDGFAVELVASEPDIVNPIAMTFDERGRIWITESIEYPRKSAGPGRDRIKVLESTRGDGQYDKITIFADGLNIPSGIAVGHGGVWVSNSPDILFLQDTRGTGRADRREVVVTGFGRFDTHELPSSLTWGPDGYLYGLNGVFNE